MNLDAELPDAMNSTAQSLPTDIRAQDAPLLGEIVSLTPEYQSTIVLCNDELDVYNVMQSGAAYFALPSRHVSRFTGAKAAEALNGLVTNDVLPMLVGRGHYAAALTPKGKMLADVSILRVETETFLVESSEIAGREWWSMVRKYINPRLAQYKDESAAHRSIGVYGLAAPAILARLGVGGMGDQQLTDAMAEGLKAWPDWAHANFTLSGMKVRLVRSPYLGKTPGFEILVEADAFGEAISHLTRVGAVPGTENLWQLAQLEAGRPVFGLDMDANTIPQEANLDDWNAISFEKGCYTGQETVARIHFRGHVNKHLRGLLSAEALPAGSSIHDATGKTIGEVRRAGVSPQFGAIAIGMVRREVGAGAAVLVRLANSAAEVSARVKTLPFGA